MKFTPDITSFPNKEITSLKPEEDLLAQYKDDFQKFLIDQGIDTTTISVQELQIKAEAYFTSINLPESDFIAQIVSEHGTK